MTDEYDQLILKSLSGTATEEEQQQLARWMEQSQENRQAVEDYRKVWALRSSDLSTFDTHTELEKLEAKLDQMHGTQKTLSSSRSIAYKIAASVALFTVGSFMIYQTVFRTETIVKESGSEKIQFSLPDGSQIWLNENSRISYRSDFADHRDLDLSGEAFFEVTHNPEKPFVVHADKSEVKVLGTSFNVRAVAGDMKNEVYVVTGKVRMSEDDQAITLTPGEQGILNKEDHSLSRTTEANPNLIAWKSKQLIFKKASLAEVVETLEDYFDISITVNNPDLQKCRFTSSFKDPVLEEVIEALSIALDINVVHQNKKYTFDGEGCPG